MADGSADKVKASPFVERLLQKGHKVLSLTEAGDEHAISALPQFECIPTPFTFEHQEVPLLAILDSQFGCLSARAEFHTDEVVTKDRASPGKFPTPKPPWQYSASKVALSLPLEAEEEKQQLMKDVQRLSRSSISRRQQRCGSTRSGRRLQTLCSRSPTCRIPAQSPP